MQPGMDALRDRSGRRRAPLQLLLQLLLLVLLQLCVVKAAADCSKPQLLGNIVLTDASLLLNYFSEGVHVTVECANGYVIESGSGNITCIDGNWTVPDLTCKKMDCGHPKPKSNMSFNVTAGTLFGAVAKVICDKGFKVSGVSYMQCYLSGWSGKAKCEIVTCAKPAQVTNGRSSWDSQDKPKYGESIKYTCNVGYTLFGKSSITCNEYGLYDYQPPTCEEEMASSSTYSPSPGQEVSSEPASPTAPIAPTAEPFTPIAPTAEPFTPIAPTAVHVITRATPTASPPRRGGSDISTAAGKTTTTSETSMASSSLPGKHFGTVVTNKDVGYMPVIVSVTCVSLVACIVTLFLHKFLLKRKGSYDTREDLKPELLQFQNL